MNQQNHMVYNQIATEFNDTRWIPWPCTQNFLDELPSFSMGCEAGCGNGRNILYRHDLVMLGYDFCEKFCKIASDKDGNVINSDIKAAPFKNNIFDFVISVAVIHHLDTVKARLKAISEMIRILKPGGKLFILVWAFEQEKDSKRKFIKQDELVTWKSRNGKTYHRFYHLFRKNELEEMMSHFKNIKILSSFTQRGNYGIICIN